jgi:hypothetical protein
MPARKSSDLRDTQIRDAHRRFVKVMEEQRLTTLASDTKGHYLAILVSLTAKLEVPGKPLSEVVRELMAEAGPLLFQAMQS